MKPDDDAGDLSPAAGSEDIVRSGGPARTRPRPRSKAAVRPSLRRSPVDAVHRARASRHAAHELSDLHQASPIIISEPDLHALLQRVVDTARARIGTRYGALSWLDDTGVITDLVVSGLTAEQIAHIGPAPKGDGLFALVIAEGQSLRLADVTRHPASVGFPRHHPSMRSLLAVPITIPGHVLGNLYLSEPVSGRPFSLHDEQVLQRFAAQAAVALVNARLHRHAHATAIATERERLARELHDSLAQVLGYAMTKSEAALTHLTAGNAEAAGRQIQQLHDAAQAAYGDVREHILGLRVGTTPDTDLATTLEAFLTTWQDHAGIPVSLALPGPDTRHRLAIHPPATRLQILRIAQEATSNIRKHAHATSVRVSLHQAGGVTELRIADDGRGFSPHLVPSGAQPRFGLATMRERADAIGGTLEVASSRAGTTVTLRVPATQVRST